MNPIPPPNALLINAKEPLVLPFIEGIVEGGFPSPEEDHTQFRLDLSELLMTHKDSTHYFQITGRSMIGKDLQGEAFTIPHGALLQVDRSLSPRSGDVVIGYLYGSGWTVKFYQKDKRGNVTLMPANKEFEPIFITDEGQFLFWGVVVWVVNPMHAITRNRVKNIGRG